MKRASTTEDLVVGEVWREFGGVLTEQFAIPSERPRYLDALIIDAAEPKLVASRHVPDLSRRRLFAVEVKSGVIDMGVLGQALFGAQLVIRKYPDAEVTPVAAALWPPDALLCRLLTQFQPDGLIWRAYPDLRRPGKAQVSSGEPNPRELRETLLAQYVKHNPGLLIKIDGRRHQGDFHGVRVGGCEHRLSGFGLSALLLRDREPGVIAARVADVTLQSSERVHLIHTATDLYRTQMGKALFSGELARRLLNLPRAHGIALYARDNWVLRELLNSYPAARAVQHAVQ